MGKARRFPTPCACLSILIQAQEAEGYRVMPIPSLVYPKGITIPSFVFSGSLIDAKGRRQTRMIPYTYCPICGSSYWTEVKEDE